MTSQHPQLSGTYATWRGESYYARPVQDFVYLYTPNPELPEGFEPTTYYRFHGLRRVPVGEIDCLAEVTSTCRYRGEPFEISNVVDGTAYVRYVGRDLDRVCKWDGMERPDRYDIYGEAPLAELSDFEVTATEIPLPGQEPR